MRGLASLTEPADDEPVGAIVDLAVMGARGDGKTQFIVHAIRTLRAYAPHLTGAEHQYNREIMQVVMNARTPRPDHARSNRCHPRPSLGHPPWRAHLSRARRRGPRPME